MKEVTWSRKLGVTGGGGEGAERERGLLYMSRKWDESQIRMSRRERNDSNGKLEV